MGVGKHEYKRTCRYKHKYKYKYKYNKKYNTSISISISIITKFKTAICWTNLGILLVYNVICKL